MRRGEQRVILRKMLQQIKDEQNKEHQTSKTTYTLNLEI